MTNLSVQTNLGSTTAANTATAGTSSAKTLRQLFKHKPTQAANDSEFAAQQPWEVLLLEGSNELKREYETYKIDFGDRSNEAFWQVMQKVFTYVQGIDQDGANGQLKKASLVKYLKAKGYERISASNSTASVVVKYVFADQAKQTLSNYTNVMLRAAALDVQCDKFAEFLKRHGGIVKVLETHFDENGNATETAPKNQELEQAKADSKNRLLAYKRSLFAQSHVDAIDVAFDGLEDWVPEDPRKDEAKKKDPDNIKYKRGSFVYFVGVPGEEDGNYKIVQGFSPAEDFEQRMLSQLLPFCGATTDDLRDFAIAIEQSVGIFENIEDNLS